MTTKTYRVSGMTCSHCVAAVTEEVRAVPGVGDVSVDLESGRLTVFADGDSADGGQTGEVDDAAIRAAVEEAGYEVTV